MSQIYKIQKGDTLSDIAQRAYNNNSKPYQMAIYKMNQREIGDITSSISPGMFLWIDPISNPSPSTNSFYIVQKGDTLSDIAQRAYNNNSKPYQMAIYKMNQREIGDITKGISPGMSLWIPIIGHPPQKDIVYIVQPRDTLSGIAQQSYNSGLELYRTAICRINKLATCDDQNATHPGDPLYLPPISYPTPSQNTCYIVQDGETLSDIAQQAYHNRKKTKLISQSVFNKKGRIKPGEILCIPSDPSSKQFPPGGGNIHPPGG